LPKQKQFIVIITIYHKSKTFLLSWRVIYQ